jgi:ubiquinol-cytochrome c reductase cytochrome c1 subunit
MMLRQFVLVLTLLASPALAAGGSESHTLMSPDGGWSHAGIFGTYDRGALQRGFLVYKQVCSACHSMNLVSYRNLSGLGYNEEEIKAIAAQYTVTDGPDDEGKMFERKARPSDHFVAPFANEKAARYANNGAYPPDMSLLAKARHGGEDYIYSILMGYSDAPHEMKMMPGMHYNKFYAGGQIGMTPPLAADDLVTYSDGTKATKEQMAKDVATFLTWAAEPHMEDRKRIGIRVIIFLLVMAGIFYAAKRQLWQKMH